MLRAKKSNGEIVHVNEIKQGDVEYYCLCCNQKLQIRQGKYNKAHFSHLKVVSKKSHDFSEHQYLQQYLRKELEKRRISAKLEAKISEHHRADLICSVNNQKFAIEIQRTHIADERINQRIEQYQKEGYQIIWIIPLHSIKSATTIVSANTWLLTLFKLDQKIIFYCREKGGFYYPYWFLKLSSKKIVCDLLNLEKNVFNFFTLETQYPLRKRLIIELMEKQFIQWKRWFKRTMRVQDILAQALYRNQRQIDNFPFIILTLDINMLIFTASYFWLQVLITVLYLVEKQTVITIFQLCKKQQILTRDYAIGLQAIANYCAYLEKIPKVETITKRN